MVIQILPPDEAKKRARANVAAWKRERALRAAKRVMEPEKTEPPGSVAERSAEGKEELNSQLLESAEQGDADGVRVFLDRGADIDARTDHDVTALMWASAHGHKETAELLLERGADVNARSNSGKTALIVASDNGHKETAELLLENGADVNARTVYGVTALRYASARGHKETAELLRRHGAKE